MKFPLRIYFLSAIFEGVIYTIVPPHFGFVVLPFAFIGGIPGLFVFTFLMGLIETQLPSSKAKWIAIIAAQFACANGTLLLFLRIMNLPISEQNFLYLIVLNIAVTLAFALSIKQAKKSYFTISIPNIDIDGTDNIFNFKPSTDEN